MEPPQNEENQSSSENKQNYQPLNAEDIKKENIQRLNKNAEKLRKKKMLRKKKKIRKIKMIKKRIKKKKKQLKKKRI